jgi:hypothetical protein
MKRLALLLLGVAAFAMFGAAAAAPSDARQAADDDVFLKIEMGDAHGGVPAPGRTTSKGLGFQQFFEVDTTNGVIQPVTLNVSLPAGLHWAPGTLQSNDGCQDNTPGDGCTAPLGPNPLGTIGIEWFWDVIADHAGTYSVTATVTPAEPDPNTANNTATFQFQVNAPA